MAQQPQRCELVQGCALGYSTHVKLEGKAPLGSPWGGRVGCGRAGRQGFPGVGQWSVYPQKQLTISSLQNRECRFAVPI